MTYHGIQIPPQRLAEFCTRNHIQRLSLFGSILTGRFRPDSDVDILVEFEPGQTPGFMRMAGLELELSEMIGRKVELRTPAELSPYIRDEVLQASETQYAAG